MQTTKTRTKTTSTKAAHICEWCHRASTPTPAAMFCAPCADALRTYLSAANDNAC